MWQSQALAHLKGTKHAKKLKALDAPKTKPKGPGVTKDSANPEITKGGAGSRVPNCSEGTGWCFSLPHFRCFLFLSLFCFEKWVLEPAKTPIWKASGISPRVWSLMGWTTYSVDDASRGRVPNRCSHTEFAELTGSLRARHNLSKSLNANLLSFPNTLDSGFAAE